jgi:hypothetical protein
MARGLRDRRTHDREVHAGGPLPHGCAGAPFVTPRRGGKAVGVVSPRDVGKVVVVAGLRESGTWVFDRRMRRPHRPGGLQGSLQGREWRGAGRAWREDKHGRTLAEVLVAARAGAGVRAPKTGGEAGRPSVHGSGNRPCTASRPGAIDCKACKVAPHFPDSRVI